MRPLLRPHTAAPCYVSPNTQTRPLPNPNSSTRHTPYSVDGGPLGEAQVDVDHDRTISALPLGEAHRLAGLQVGGVEIVERQQANLKHPVAAKGAGSGGEAQGSATLDVVCLEESVQGNLSKGLGLRV